MVSPSVDQMLTAARTALDAATVAVDHPARVAAERALADALAVDPNLGSPGSAAMRAMQLAQAAVGAD